MGKQNRGPVYALVYFFVLTPLSLFVALIIIISSFIIRAIKEKLGWEYEKILIEPTVRHARVAYIRQ